MILKISNSVEFETLLNALCNEAVTANIHFRLLKELETARSEFGLAYQQTPTFWNLTLQAHMDKILLHLCRIYDQETKTLSLRNLLDTIEANLHLFDVEHFRERLKENPFVESLADDAKPPSTEELRSDLDSVNHLDRDVKALVIWRGNVIAHLNADLVIQPTNFSERFPFTMEQVERLLANAMRILNRYSLLFRASSYSTMMPGQDDFRHILRVVKREVERGREEMNQQTAAAKAAAGVITKEDD